jgi:hypothetical protein
MKTWALGVFVLASVHLLSTAPNAWGSANKECVYTVGPGEHGRADQFV